jgi:hypothetical protein
MNLHSAMVLAKQRQADFHREAATHRHRRNANLESDGRPEAGSPRSRFSRVLAATVSFRPSWNTKSRPEVA